MALAAQQKAVAQQLVRAGAPVAGRGAVLTNVGMSVEFALKAAIMRKERMNRWPLKSEPGGAAYHTHNLNALRAKLGWKIGKNDPVAPLWQVVIIWNRSRDYTYGGTTPLATAKGYLEAAYGPNGVMEWIARSML